MTIPPKSKVKQADLAAHLDLSTRHVRELFDKGVLSCDRQRIDLDQCRIEYIRYLRNLASRWEKEDQPVDDELDPDKQLALLRIEQIELAKIKKDKTLGRLIDRNEMVVAVSAAFSRVKSKMLKIPKSAAAPLADMEDEADVREYLDDEIRNALEELAATPVEAIGQDVEDEEIDLGTDEFEEDD